MTNGTLQYIKLSGGGISNEGDPVSIVQEWSDPIDCLIITLKHDNKGTYNDGKFTASAYEIHIESQPFEATKVKLTNSRNKELGEFQVQDLQFLDLVGRIKIVV